MPNVSEAKKKVFKFPKKLGTNIDRLDELDRQISKVTQEFSKKLAPLDEEYKALEKHLIDSFPNSDLNGATGSKGTRADVKSVTVPNAKDWEKTYAYIKKFGAFELLHKRLSTTACRERWESPRAKDRVIPGVEQFIVKKIELTRKKPKK